MSYDDMSSVETDGKPYAVDPDDTRLMSGLAGYIRKQFSRAEDARYTEEEKWIKAYKNYRGVYDSDVQFLETEKSRIFIKVTKTKVLAAYSQIVDVLLANDIFPITIEPSVLPEGVAESVSFDPKEPEGVDIGEQPVDLVGFEGDGKPLPPGATQQTLLEDRLGPLEDLLSDIPNLREGDGNTQSSVTFHPAMVAAKKMEKQIKDQLDESNASTHLRYAAFECSLFGTGIVKGPFASTKEYPNWEEDGEYNPTIRTVPNVSHTSIWDFYPDPDGYTINECDFVIERHKMTRSQLRALRRRPFFDEDAINRALEMGENYEVKWWENDLITAN